MVHLTVWTSGLDLVALAASLWLGLYTVTRNPRSRVSWLAGLTLWSLSGYFYDSLMHLNPPPGQAPRWWLGWTVLLTGPLWLHLSVRLVARPGIWHRLAVAVGYVWALALLVAELSVGGVFGVGFLREYLKTSYGSTLEEIKHHHDDDDPEAVEAFLNEYKAAPMERKRQLLEELKQKSTRAHLTKKERKALSRIYRKELVKRTHLWKIAAAWIITVPASGIMAAMLYFMIRGMMLPQ